MTVTAPASLTKIVAEFGGALPHALSEYVRGGAYVGSNNTGVSATVAGLSINSFVGAQAFAPASGNYTSELFGLGQDPRVAFESDGNVSGYSSADLGNWGNPLITGVGSGYEISATSTGGTAALLFAALDTWYGLSSSVVYSIDSAPSGQARSRSLSYTIRVAGGGATVATGTITLISDLTA